jgi:hypothetical protein
VAIFTLGNFSRWQKDVIYLDIKVNIGLNNVVKNNWNPIIQSFKEDFDKWNSLNLHLWGETGVVK